MYRSLPIASFRPCRYQQRPCDSDCLPPDRGDASLTLAGFARHAGQTKKREQENKFLLPSILPCFSDCQDLTSPLRSRHQPHHHRHLSLAALRRLRPLHHHLLELHHQDYLWQPEHTSTLQAYEKLQSGPRLQP
jgi:hypothetical protein